MIRLYTPEDLRRAGRRADILRRVSRGALTADEACDALGMRRISGGALPVTLSTTQVGSTDSPGNAPTLFNTNVFQAFEDLFGIPNAVAIGRTLLRSVLSGCQLSNDGTSPNTVIDVSAGIAMSSDNLLLMDIAAFTGSTGGIWASGSGGNKMDTSTAVAANTWYHPFVIGGGGNPTDILFSTSATAPTLPGTYTKQRRIGSFRTATGTTNILAFTQDDDLFYWNTPPTIDVAANNPGTAAVTRTLTVPTGVNVRAIVNVFVRDDGLGTANITSVYLSDLATADTAAGTTAAPLGHAVIRTQAADMFGGGQAIVRTNTSGQIRSRLSTSTANITLYITTLGWIDRRGMGT